MSVVKLTPTHARAVRGALDLVLALSRGVAVDGGRLHRVCERCEAIAPLLADVANDVDRRADEERFVIGVKQYTSGPGAGMWDAALVPAGGGTAVGVPRGAYETREEAVKTAKRLWGDLPVEDFDGCGATVGSAEGVPA